jgi:hypothetical protein
VLYEGWEACRNSDSVRGAGVGTGGQGRARLCSQRVLPRGATRGRRGLSAAMRSARGLARRLAWQCQAQRAGVVWELAPGHAHVRSCRGLGLSAERAVVPHATHFALGMLWRGRRQEMTRSLSELAPC